MSYTTKNWVHRKVRNGYVIIRGKRYYPDNKEAGHLLNSRVMVFGLYPSFNAENTRNYVPTVSLWGTLRMWQAIAQSKDEDDPEYNAAWVEFCELTCDKEQSHHEEGVTVANMVQEPDGTFKSYHSIGLNWWKVCG